MKHFITTIAVLLLCGQAFAQFPPIDRPVAFPSVEAKPAPVKLNTSKPYVVFVKVDQSPIAGVQSIRDDSYDARGVFIVMPGDRWYRVNDTSDIAGEVRRWEVSRPASFFDGFKRPIAGRDDSEKWLPVGEQERLMRLWPKSVDSSGFRFYKQTKYSQRIAITGDRPSLQWYRLDRHDVWANAPTSFNPNSTKPEWIAPGGLHGLDGWESYTAAYLPDSPNVWKQPIPIANGGLIPGYLWAYPDGSAFADMLVKDDHLFELRMREKDAGRWDSFVAYRDKSNAPSGYHGAGKRCADCHDRGPGASEQYGIVVRGNDTVFSFNPME